MQTIRDYIESLFIGIDHKPEVEKLKLDLLASAEDRYDDLKEQGKTESEAIGTVISEFGSIDEILEEMNIKKEYFEENGMDINEITVDEGQLFLEVRRKSSAMIGIGVMSCMLGVSFLFMMMWRYGEGAGIPLGIIGLLFGAAIGVGLFIVAGLNISKINASLNDRLISTQIKTYVKKAKESFQRSFIFSLVSGIILCILSLIPVVYFGAMEETDQKMFLSIAIFMCIASVGVFLLIFGSATQASFAKLIETKYFVSDEGNLGPKAKAEQLSKAPKWYSVLERVYWPTVVGIYLIQSLITGNWGTSWSIFPVAGIAHWVLASIFVKD